MNSQIKIVTSIKLKKLRYYKLKILLIYKYTGYYSGLDYEKVSNTNLNLMKSHLHTNY